MPGDVDEADRGSAPTVPEMQIAILGHQAWRTADGPAQGEDGKDAREPGQEREGSAGVRAAIYARVSKEKCTVRSCGHLKTDHAAGKGACTKAKCRCIRYEGQDPENQLAELRAYAARAEWEIAEYVDYETGKHSDRDSLNRLFDDASRRKFDVLLVWALDRLTREGIGETFQYLKKLKGFGVSFESYSEPQFRTTGPYGDMFAELLIALAAWFAKQERLRISERTTAGLERARKEGRIGGRRPRMFDRRKAQKLRDQGLSWRNISRKMGIAQSSIRDALRPTEKGVRETSPRRQPRN
jgi:DNA invertase Pin-like site-specific DNA recombinase